MRKFLFLLVLFLPDWCLAQSLFHSDCGTWVADSVNITEWKDVDTLKKPVLTKDRQWVEDVNWQRDDLMYTYAVWSPCGSDPSHSEYQYRICSITGIRQKRYRIYSFHYVQREKSDYQKTVEKFK